jgi:hypothetical protein
MVVHETLCVGVRIRASCRQFHPVRHWVIKIPSIFRINNMITKSGLCVISASKYDESDDGAYSRGARATADRFHLVEDPQLIHNLGRVPLSQTAGRTRSMRLDRVDLRHSAVACCATDRDPRASTPTRRSSALGQTAAADQN